MTFFSLPKFKAVQSLMSLTQRHQGAVVSSFKRQADLRVSCRFEM